MARVRALATTPRRQPSERRPFGRFLQTRCHPPPPKRPPVELFSLEQGMRSANVDESDAAVGLWSPRPRTAHRDAVGDRDRVRFLAPVAKCVTCGALMTAAAETSMCVFVGDRG